MNAKQKHRFVFFGDSICVGQDVSIHKGWVTRLAACINEVADHHGRELVVVNASVNGNTTRQALERMPYDVQSGGVDAMVVQFGMNDCNHWLSDSGLPRVSPGAFKANLKEIIQRGRVFGAKWVLLNTNHPTTRNATPMPPSNTTYEESNSAYNDIVRAVAHDLGDEVNLIDVEREFWRLVNSGGTLGDYLLDDGLHLSVKGHDAYFSLIEPIVKPLVSEIIESL